ncbi:MAG: helix-turn-helix domain-containing protein [Methanobrevibacter sp.]|nr:helix-turn-helix domain-containing protein [Methanobrevibacter sp.]
MLRFKIDIMQALKDKGYNTNIIRKNSLLSEGALQQIRRGAVPGTKSIDNICKMLNKQPGYFLEWIPDDTPAAADQE